MRYHGAIVLLAAAFLGGCAQAGKGDPIVVGDAQDKASTPADAPANDQGSDTGSDTGSGTGSGSGSGTGSGSGSGSATCTPGDVLVNGNFDAATRAMGWTEEGSAQIVRSDGRITEQSAPNDAWMGGIEEYTDDLYQDVAIPAGATGLTLTGYYQVRTTDYTDSLYDWATVDLKTTGGAAIESIYTKDQLNNEKGTTSWQAINHVFSTVPAGQTVRLYFATSNDVSNYTDFYFDTLKLVVSCQ